MCDYSLMNFPNRLAQEGEELVVHRFPTGSLGMASPLDVQNCVSNLRGRSFWRRMKDVLCSTRDHSVRAVCVPPSARLAVFDVPASMQAEFGVAETEEVRFEQLSENVNAYRDAIAFQNGRRIRLQELPVGFRMRVIDMGGAEHSGDDAALRATERDPVATSMT